MSALPWCPECGTKHAPTDNHKLPGPSVTEEHLTYLDGLRESGVTNMFGAGVFIEAAFGVSKANARMILDHWMRTFEERHKN